MTADGTPAGTPSRADVTHELRKLRTRTFGEIPGSDMRRRYPVLTALADNSGVTPVGGDLIRGLLLTVVRELNPAGLRDPASALFGLSAATYAKPHAVRRDAAISCFAPQPTESTFRQQPQYLKLILDRLTDALLSYHSERRTELTQSSFHPDTGVSRLGLEARIRAMLQAQSSPLTLWGEGGNGKTHLARNIAAELAAEMPVEIPVVVIRRGTLTDERTYQADLIECLAAVGQGSQSWSLAAQELAVRDLISGPRCFAAVVLDDVDEASCNRLIPQACACPVLITTRSKPTGGRTEIRVDAYENTEALAAIQLILGNSNTESLGELCRILGNRPVAIDISARMVNAGYTTINGLISALTEDMPGTLESSYQLLDENVEASIVRLYAEVHERLISNPAAAAIVDVLLWLSSGSVKKYALEAFLARKLQTDAQRIAHDAAIAWLSGIGLARMERETIEINALSQTLLRWLGNGQIDRVARDFFQTLLEVWSPFRPTSSPPKPWYISLEETNEQVAGVLQALGSSLRITTSIFTDLLDGDRFTLICLGIRDWLIKESDLDFYFDRSANERFGLVHIDDSAIVLWSASGPPRKLTAKQAVLLLLMMRLCGVVERSDMEHVMSPEVTERLLICPIERFEWHRWTDSATDNVKYVHQPLDVCTGIFSVTGGLESWSLCGRRFIRQTPKEEGVSCSECVEFRTSFKRLYQLEDLINQVLSVLDAGSRLHSSDGAYWFAARGKVQQLLGDIQVRGRRDEGYLSAAQSYLASFRCMVNAAQDDLSWRVEFGYGLVEQMAQLPGLAAVTRAAPICDWLIGKAVTSDVEMIYQCSQMFAKSRHYKAALEGYDRCLALLEDKFSGGGPLDIAKITRERAEIAEKIRVARTTRDDFFVTRGLPSKDGDSPGLSDERSGFTEVEIFKVYIQQERTVQSIVLKEIDGASFFIVPARWLQAVSAFYLAQSSPEIGDDYLLPVEILKVLGIRLDYVILSIGADGTLVLPNDERINVDPADAIIIALCYAVPIAISPDGTYQKRDVFNRVQSALSLVRPQGGRIAVLHHPGGGPEMPDPSDMRKFTLSAAGIDLARHPFVVLKEEQDDRRISFPVTLPEAVALDAILHGSTRVDHITYDTISKVLTAVNVRLEACRIVRVGSEVCCLVEFSDDRTVRAAVGDGIALAFRTRAPILVAADLANDFQVTADRYEYPTTLRWAIC